MKNKVSIEVFNTENKIISKQVKYNTIAMAGRKAITTLFFEGKSSKLMAYISSDDLKDIADDLEKKDDLKITNNKLNEIDLHKHQEDVKITKDTAKVNISQSEEKNICQYKIVLKTPFKADDDLEIKSTLLALEIDGTIYPYNFVKGISPINLTKNSTINFTWELYF